MSNAKGKIIGDTGQLAFALLEKASNLLTRCLTYFYLVRYKWTYGVIFM